MTSAAVPVPPAELGRREDRAAARTVALSAVAVVAGALIRLEHLLGGRSLHIDEARLALNIGRRSFAGLLEPLAFEQTAPIPFLWLEKAASLLGGVNEIALRFLPYLLGCGLLIATYQLARRLLPAAGAVLAVALAAVSPVLVHYSNEIKPYIGDALLGAWLTLLAIDLVRSPGSREWTRFLVVGTVAVAVSTPAILVLLGLGLVIGISCRRSPGMTRRVAVALVAWLAIFAVLYVVFYRAMSSHPYMRQFWQPAFLTADAGPILPRAWGMLSELVWGTFMGGYVHGVRAREIIVVVGAATVVFGLVMTAGGEYLRRSRGGTTLALVLAPAVVTIAASIAGAYPISLRLVLYLVPTVLVLVVGGVLFALDRVPEARRMRVLLLVGLALMLRPAMRSVLPRFWPYHPQELRPLVSWVNERGPTEPVYVFANAVPAWLFYTTDWAQPDTARLNWYERVASAGGPAFENAAPRNRPVVDEGSDLIYEYRGRRELLGVSTGEQWRVVVGSVHGRPDRGWEANEARRIIDMAQPGIWLVFSHFRGSENGLLEQLENGGLRQAEAHVAIGAHVFRYAK